MKFGRKSSAKAEKAPDDDTVVETPDATDAPEDASSAAAPAGPYDVADVDLEEGGVERVDLGGMLIPPAEGMELRLQVNEESGEVQSVLVAGPTGAVEVRAFAAQRNGDLWSDVRSQIAEESTGRGDEVAEREGRHGTELVVQRTVKLPDGTPSVQPSRIIGVNGPRWFLRATYLGSPAVDPDAAGPWDAVVDAVVVRRGTEAMAPGDPLPVTLPPQARRVK